jgi:thiamine biosynthesis lipoprotein ApbE
MRELILPFAILPAILPANVNEAETWWTVAQRNGVGFVFFVLFLALTALSVRREKKAETERKAREIASEIARAKREDKSNAERLAMQSEIRDLNEKQLAQAVKHSTRLENVIKEGNKAAADVAVEMKNLARRVRCPGTTHHPTE